MENTPQPPKDQAASPLNGVVPPPEHRFKPGQSGNPEGRKTAGATIREHMNSLAEHGLDESALRTIARNKKAPWTQRAAAERILRTLEHGDLADMEDILRGTANLKQLRESGINTEVIKKIKVKKRVMYDGHGNECGEETEREVELHDRAGDDFDRVMDRTDGKPSQALDITSKGNSIVKVLHGVSTDDL